MAHLRQKHAFVVHRPLFCNESTPAKNSSCFVNPVITWKHNSEGSKPCVSPILIFVYERKPTKRRPIWSILCRFFFLGDTTPAKTRFFFLCRSSFSTTQRRNVSCLTGPHFFFYEKTCYENALCFFSQSSFY